MKHNITFIIMTVMLSMTSCTTGFYEMNTNPNQVTGEQMEVNNYRTGSKIRNLQNLVIPVQEKAAEKDIGIESP